MTVVRVKGFKIFKDRHGRERCYHRKTGEKIDLTKAPKGSVEFLAECARISALAEPGEVLVSRTVRDLVAGSGIEFADRGEHSLKGVPGTWQLFAVKQLGAGF